jgi:hypothetical protein
MKVDNVSFSKFILYFLFLVRLEFELGASCFGKQVLYCCRMAQTETERVPKLLESKFMKQASSDSADLSPKAEP